MKILKKVSVREVKRAFVIANSIRIQKNGRRYLGKISEGEFLRKFQQSKQKGLRMTNTELDAYVVGAHSKKDPLRLQAYNASDWYIGEIRPNEVGPWRRSGELPLSWTNQSLKDTADKIRHALEKGQSLPGRARHTIPNILATNVSMLQSEKYLLPILFKGGTGTRGRSRLKRVMKGDIDDGCMRSIALAVSGVRVIRAYIGFPKKMRVVH